MPTLCRPALVLPEHRLSQEQSLAIASSFLEDKLQRELIQQVIRNSAVEERACVISYDEIFKPKGFGSRNAVYTKKVLPLAEQAVQIALDHAQVSASEIDLIIVTSCTGILIPSLDAYLINTMSFRQNVRRLPISQLGCAAGAAAVRYAHDYCRAYPQANVLIIAAELASLWFHPRDLRPAALISAALFADGVAALVVRGKEVPGFSIEITDTCFLPNTTHFMGFEVQDTGFHIVLDKEVVQAIRPKLIPQIQKFFTRNETSSDAMDFYLLHPGGAKMMDQLETHLPFDPQKIQPSRESLRRYGNLSSASVFSVLKLLFEEYRPASDAKGALLAFGPGFSIEMGLGQWNE